MNSNQSNCHLNKILDLQSKGQKEYGAKIDKYLADNKLIIMSGGWRDLSIASMRSFNFDCEQFLKFYTKTKPANGELSNGQKIFTSHDIKYYYDVVTEKELKEFREKTWPAFVEANKKMIAGIDIQEKLDKLHKKEDAIKEEIRQLERQLKSV